MQLAPVSRAERLRGVDIARGIALLGILLVNVRLFFLPLGAALDPSVSFKGLEESTADLVAWSLVETFCTYKFISLFSLLFGFGLAVQASRAAASGRSRWSFGARRLGVMLAFGLTHALLIWFGDILTIYSLLGFGVLAFVGVSVKWIKRSVAIIVSLMLILTVLAAAAKWVFMSNPDWFGTRSTTTEVADGGSAELEPGGDSADVPAAPEVVASNGDASDVDEPVGGASLDPLASSDEAETDSDSGSDHEVAAPPRGFKAMLASQFDISSDVWIDAEVAAFRDGPFLDALTFRAVGFGFGFLAGLFGYGWHAFAMMLFGVYAFKTGLFSAESSSRRRRLGFAALAIGLPIAVAPVIGFWLLGRASPTAGAVHAIFIEVGALILPIAYATLLVEFGPRLPALVATALERTGRMALSVYLLESIVCVTLASWWGLGWYGSMLDAKLSLIAIAVWLALVVLASLWLARFRIGPMEALWRRLSYGRAAGE